MVRLYFLKIKVKETEMKNNSKKNLKAICSIVPNRPALPILGNVLFENDGKIEVTASNLEIWIKCELPNLEGVHRGDYIIPKASAKELGKVAFNNLITYDDLVDEFPQFPEMDILETITIKSAILLDAFKKGLWYLKKDHVRTWTSTIAFNGKRICATDKRHLYFVDMNTQQFKSDEMLLIPNESAKLLTNIAWENMITVKRSKGALSFTDSKTTVICYLIDAKFPDYERVIPDYQPVNEISINPDVSKCLIKELKTIKSLFKNEHELRDIVVLTATNGNLQIAVDKNKNDKHEYQVNFLVDTNINESVSTGFNWNFLLDAIETFKDENFTIRFKDYGIAELSPLLLYTDNSIKVKTHDSIHESELSVLMPVRNKK